jgi:glycosyltransferase involved in cell wall biosynthesis
MKITFLLPGPGDVPIGGFKIVYQYANALTERGHSVSIIHSQISVSMAQTFEIYWIAILFWFRRLFGWFGGRGWFELNKNINSRLENHFAERTVPDADVIVATAWETAHFVASLPISKGKKFYLIQHFETWSGSKEQVLATWKLPLQKIVIAKWLQEIAISVQESSIYIPNGLDFLAFGMDVKPESRKHSILFLYHFADWKGSNDAIQALELVRQRVPIEVHAFGASKPSKTLPSWIKFHHRPSRALLRDLYNQAAIFVAPSWSEGWGLTACEAMMCGAAIVATDIGGHREFLEHQKNAYLSEIQNSQNLAQNILRLLSDQELRIKLALAGHESIQQFTWTRAVDSFESALNW